ncbi:MAG: hypothetical protein NWE95_13740 [Candidatus Bathyarchaeota archaeon]|nr:hypothetical protein [Candidatus Bathyarchaeota archaeon]
MKGQRQPAIDPAVSALIDSMEKSRAERAHPMADRKRQRKEREKNAKRNRVMLDLPPELEARLVALAHKIECPISQAAAYLLAIGLSELDAGRVDLRANRKPSKSPKFAWNLDLAEILEKLR